MVPPKKAFPPYTNVGYREFGYVSNRSAAGGWTLPKFTPEELTKAGRLAGYLGGLVGGCGGLCRPGLLNFSTEVHVFGNAAQASRFVAALAERYPIPGERRLYGKRLSVELFDPPGLGEEAVGVRTGVDLGCCSETITETLVLFRVGQVVGLSRASNLNFKGRPGTYPDARAARFARMLKRHVEAVLAGRGDS
jgi:hypothetical protein